MNGTSQKETHDQIQPRGVSPLAPLYEMLRVTCPKCGGRKLEKYGKTKVGKQKYRCLRCRRQFVPGSAHLLDPEIKRIVEKSLAENIRPKKVFNLVTAILAGRETRKEIPQVERGISLRWIYALRRRLKSGL
ncbi:MAG: IS1 family transposase [Syntrophaceae bacterium]|nr:IS1 family transposase [Syntrophaceae bacterium]